MAQLITGDPTQGELKQPAETAYEANQHFYTPSERYRKILDILDKDIILANFEAKEMREMTLVTRIMLNSIELEDTKGWKGPDGQPNREISDYWIKRAALIVSLSRAKRGETARLSRTGISEQRIKKDESTLIGEKKGGLPNPFSGFIPRN